MLGAVWVVGAVGVMWAVRARGGPGTHWQPLNTLQTPTKGSRNAGSVVRAVGVMWAVRARGGPGTHWQPLKTF